MRNSGFLFALALGTALAGSAFGQEASLGKASCGADDPDHVREIRRTPRAEVGTDELGNVVYKINGNESWRRTDVEVKRGNRVEITAAGTIQWAPDVQPWTIVKADGTRPPYRDGWNYNHFPFPEAGIGSLVMRIGKGVYPAGSSVAIEAEDDGWIEFMVNDDVLTDNSGSFQVRVNVRAK